VANKSPRKMVAAIGQGTRLSDLAYNRVLEVLFERRLPAGAFVSQSQLVELTEVPVAPLRDALRVLESEGVLTIYPRTGIQFTKPGFELTRSTYQFRAIIEMAAVAQFAENASDGEIADLENRHLEAIKRIERDGLSPDELIGLEELETSLHGSIVACLNNPLIDTSYRRIRNYIWLVRLDRRVTPPIVLRSLKEHVAIIEACRRRDADDAVAALKTHFAGALQRSLGL
jgi:DNA-binding GntR family transcriptional regulator